MKVLEIPANLRPGNLLFAPRLAPRLARIGEALDLGLSELTHVPFARLRGAMALSTEMRGQEIQVLLLFVRNSRPLMIQASKLRLKSFELEPAKTPENLRVLLQCLGQLAPHLLIDDGTEAFLDGGSLQDVGVRIVDAATTFGTLMPQSTPSEEGESAEEAREAADEAREALAEAERTVAELAEAGVGKADEPEEEIAEGDAEPGAREPSEPPPEPSADSAEAAAEDPANTKNVWWIEHGQQMLVAFTADAVLVVHGDPRVLEAQEKALEAGKNPRIVLGSEAHVLSLRGLERVRLLPERRYVSLSDGKRNERITCSDEGLARQLFAHLEAALPSWHRQRRSLSRKTALTPYLALPAGLTILWLVLLGLTLRGGDEAAWMAALSIDIMVVGGLVVVGLSLLPALRRLREPPPEAEELLPSPPSG